MKLHLGVLDIPYKDEEGASTGDVAQILEDKYGVMERFFDKNAQGVADDLADSVAGSLENMIAGLTPRNPFSGAMSKTEKRFRRFLDAEDIVGTGAPDVPTKAALKGKSKRFKRSSGPRRPSFIDSGQYEACFKAWID